MYIGLKSLRNYKLILLVAFLAIFEMLRFAGTMLMSQIIDLNSTNDYGLNDSRIRR